MKNLRTHLEKIYFVLFLSPVKSMWELSLCDELPHEGEREKGYVCKKVERPVQPRTISGERKK